MSYPLFEHFRDHVGSVSGMFAVGITERPIVIDGEAEFVTADLVSGSYYAVLGIEPAAGRLLGPADDEISPAAPAAVISDRFWLRRFGRSPSAIGTSLRIRDRVFTIVGATPRSFLSTRRGFAPDITLPLLTMMNDNQRVESGLNWLSTLARLKPGETIERANTEVQAIWGSFVQAQTAEAPEKDRQAVLRQRAGAFAAPDGYNPLRYNYAQSLAILMGIVALVLTLACVNLSGLLLARAASRQREISIRLAIGAGRGRLVRQFLTESLVLASLGGGIGVALAWWFSARLVTLFANGNDLVLSAGARLARARVHRRRIARGMPRVRDCPGDSGRPSQRQSSAQGSARSRAAPLRPGARRRPAGDFHGARSSAPRCSSALSSSCTASSADSTATGCSSSPSGACSRILPNGGRWCGASCSSD